MQHARTFLGSRSILIFSTVAILAFIALAANMRSLGASSASSATVQTQNGSDRTEVEIVTLRPQGFEPSEITRPKGRFILVVNNQSGINELDLKLDSDKGRVKDDRLPRGKKRWKTILDLPPGDYVLTESSDPTRIAHITITPR